MIPLIVTTVHRGVFFGYGEPTTEPVIRLERARMCLIWPESNKGILGLASEGPLEGARVGPAAPSIILQGVTAVVEVAAAAVDRWEASPWR